MCQLPAAPGVGETWQAAAVLCLQTAAEAYVIQLLSDAYKICIHCRRVTLKRGGSGAGLPTVPRLNF
ncbi:hypothetical protein BOX15_Mlig003845g2 [Macrostomum lignano]|uniref:Core Histone H2A/H2B/H3 domain-containing protein n=1 Tax=Macrostomum lignano TaxID=282301 RepID=A0A267E0H8_9PLAT|nr:hypothetical protein BOX15_Mlig003845g2 [Macrostomum lignano]